MKLQNTIYKIQYTKYLLLLILLLAGFLRLYKLNQYPAGLNADEAAIGYNAYSLIETSKDEFGHSWPINFQSFNDYKPGLYFYLSIPTIKIVGLNEWGIRLPSAIMGIIAVLLIYLLVVKLFNDQKFGLVSAFLLAVSPWHLHFSRGGWESNVATTLTLAGVYFFISFINIAKYNIHNTKYLILSSISFILSMYTYHSARIVSPLLALGLVIIYNQNIFSRKNLQAIIITFFTGVIFMIPLLLSFRGEAGASRFSGVGLLADSGPYWRANELRSQHRDFTGLVPAVLHNKYIEYGLRFTDNYLRHYNGDFLFISGDEIQRNRVPESGQLLLICIPFLILGLFYLVKNKPPGWWIIFWWLFISPLASALTFQSPHAIRSLNMVIPLTLITGYGLGVSFNVIGRHLKNRLLPSAVYFLLFIGVIWNVSFYLHQYFVHYPQVYPAAWEYGFKDMSQYLKMHQDRYRRIYITNTYDQPYILTAFFLKYPPAAFQTEAELTPRDKFGFSTVGHFDKYYFEAIDWSGQYPPNSLFIGTPAEIPDNATILARIYFKDGKTEAFRIAEK